MPAANPSAYLPDSSYAWQRLASSLVVGTVSCVGLWSVVVVLPLVQTEFGTARAGASLPYTLTMVGFAFGTLVMGRVLDRTGIAVPIIVSAVCLCLGYVWAGLAGSLWSFALAHGLFIGIGAAAGFAPMMADISHWFVKRRGIAVVVAACGSYLAGTIWPLVLNRFIPLYGWRATHIGIGLFAAAVMLGLSPLFRRQPQRAVIAKAEVATEAARADLGLSPSSLQLLLTIAGFSCCVAMSMPQVHIVAYCGDLGYGVARGAEILSLMLGLGVISRVASGFVADRIGGAATLVLGSLMQALSLFLYLLFDGLTSLYVISAIFGLFQGGIVPMYAIIIRDYLPPREAGVRIGIVIMATIFGMAFGGYLSGLIFDLFASYRVAFLNGLLWNFVNLAVVSWLLMRRRPRAVVA
jgi:MFS family permease